MKTKKIISALLSVILALSALSMLTVGANAASAMKITSDKPKASIGEIITLSVDIPSGLSGVKFGVSYDTAYFGLVSAKATNLFGTAAVSASNGRIGYAAAMNGKTANAGTALKITLKVLKLNGKISTSIKEALDINDKDVTSTISDATITIKAGDTVIKFPDVNAGDWFYEAVEYCAFRGFIYGYNNGLFGPGDSIQRQDFVVIIARIAGADLSKYANKTGGFSDVVAGSYYGSSVAWATKEGIVTGYNSMTFGVGVPITREQACTILYRYMGSPAVSDAQGILAGFTDRAKISSYAVNAVAWCVQNGVISGKTPTTVAPAESASRAQIATIVMRMHKAGMFTQS